MASTEPKRYRRYRAHGAGRSGDDLAALRALNDRQRGGARRAPVEPPHPEPPGERRPGPGPPPSAPPRREPHPSRRERRRAVRRGKRWWSLRALGPLGWVGRLSALLLVAVLVWAGLGYWTLSRAVGRSNDKVTAAAARALVDPGGGLIGTPQNILVIGSDGRIGETRARADTILIMRTDPDSGRIKYLSIPRDYTRTVTEEKINSAFQNGGQAGIIRRVREVTALPIHHLIVINFRGFPRLVDELGGVSVNNPTALVDCPYPGGRLVSFPKGRVDLDGARALEFARVRKCDSDFQRAARQQALVAALKGKIVSVGSLYEAPWRGAAVIDALTTDLSTTELIKLGWLQARLDQRPADRFVLAAETGPNERQVGIPDINEQQLQRFVSGS